MGFVTLDLMNASYFLQCISLHSRATLCSLCVAQAPKIDKNPTLHYLLASDPISCFNFEAIDRVYNIGQFVGKGLVLGTTFAQY